jgi:hypothetical protein
LTLSILKRLLAACTLVTPGAALAAGFTLGSGDTAVIEPPVPVPPETPCVVTLFANAVFGANKAPIAYAPPSACPGPWAKVVLKAEIGLNKGIQYDRTGTIFLGGVPLWFGTTSEPTPTLAPSWQIQKDVTDYTSLLLNPQTGFALITNYTNSVDTSVITASAQLLFYSPSSAYPAPTVPDIIVPVAAQGGGTVALNTSTSVLSIPLNLPANVQSAKLDLYTQSQSNDEFWYTCVPNALATQLNDCGGGAFREGEIAIDSTPAGVAPVFPWIYTGGIDPYLWSPLPGVQTLDFKPFVVDLTPFAGVLSNGATHALNVSVYGANQYFSVAGALRVYLDHAATSVTGGILNDTLAATPTPVTNSATPTSTKTTIATSSNRNFTITGYIDTPAGRTITTVHETSAFTNNQVFDITATLYDQQIKQDTETLVDVKQQTGGQTTETTTRYAYPLTVSYVQRVAASGNGAATTTIGQEYYTTTLVSQNGIPTAEYDVVNAITPEDSLLFNAAGQITGNKNQSSTEVYSTYGTGQGCFTRTLTAAANLLTAATTSTRCK